VYGYVLLASSEYRRQALDQLDELVRVDWSPKIWNRQCHEFDVVGPACRRFTFKAELDLLVLTEQ
jgi:hypothetical protein